MVAEAPSGKQPLPNMITSIRIDRTGQVEIVDQLLLPNEVRWLPISTPDEAYEAIKSMKIRGAPAIASLACLSLNSYLSSHSLPNFDTPSELAYHLDPILDHLQSARPTAVNLSESLGRIRELLRTSVVDTSDTVDDIIFKVKKVCMDVHEEDLERNKEMGRRGAEWLWRVKREEGKTLTGEGDGERGLRVLTVCNTGSLATSGYGTAIGVITALFEMKRLEMAYYTQSTPYHQGSRLTSLELTTLQIPATMLCDTMLGSLFQLHEIDAVIVGADRIAANGDTANKIGTYQAAVLAHRHSIPFMVVAPVTTVDLSMKVGKEIHIEHRPPIEATQVRGRDILSGDVRTVRITPEGVGEDELAWHGVYNPSFDVTPAELITCIVTEKGIAERREGAREIDVHSVCQVQAS